MLTTRQGLACIDIAGLFSVELEHRLAVAEQIGRAAHDPGAFEVVGHGLNDAPHLSAAAAGAAAGGPAAGGPAAADAEALRALAPPLLRGIALALGLDEGHFAPLAPAGVTPQLACLGLLQTPQGAFEVRDGTGQWLAAAPGRQNGALSVVIGPHLQRLTEGALPAPQWRLLAAATRELWIDCAAQVLERPLPAFAKAGAFTQKTSDSPQ